MIKKNSLRFDPRTKFIIILGVSLLLLASRSLILEIGLFSFSIVTVAVGGKGKSAIRFVIAFLLMLFVDQYLSVHLSGFYFSIVSFVTFALRKFLPCLVLGKWILDTTEVSDFVAVMWKIHLPQSVIIPLSVVFRYFPTIKEEYNSIRGAMKIRGIHFSIEHIMVPLIFSAVNVSEELSAAALCRGLDSPCEHTSYIETRLGAADILAITGFMIMAVCVIALKIIGVL